LIKQFVLWENTKYGGNKAVANINETHRLAITSKIMSLFKKKYYLDIY